MVKHVVYCPNCNKRYLVDGSFLARRVRCRACDETFELRTTDGTPPPTGDEKRYAEYRDTGLRFLEEGKLNQALGALRQAVRHCPHLAQAHCDLGKAFLEAGRKEAARGAFQNAKKIDADCAEAASALAQLPPPPPSRAALEVGEVVI